MKRHPPDGHRWVVNAHYDHPSMVDVPDKPGWKSFDPAATPDRYGVADCFNWSIEHGQYDTEEEARAIAAELNRLDVQGPLDPAFTQRRDRLKQLAPDFGSWSHEGPSEARWPVRPKKFAVDVIGHGWHAEDWWYLADDEAELLALLADDESTVLAPEAQPSSTNAATA